MNVSSPPQTSTTPRQSGVWVINPGSSSIKWAWYAALTDAAPAFAGQADAADMASALAAALAQRAAATAVVRFVHGGIAFTAPTRVTADVLQALHSLADLAPLHNRYSLECSAFLLREFPGLRLIAVFDTEFFHALPEVAQLYGLPESLRRKYALRRFGFHGFAHAGMLRFWQNTTEARANRLITLQLGSGCSMAAIRDGLPLDTTMGFTPNEGLLMASRCGDIDPGLVTWLQRREGWNPEETDRQLNTQSGWLGVSGMHARFSDLLTSDSDAAKRALALFSHRIRKTLGAYFAVLGGLDGVVLSGGVAEHAVDFCRQLLAELAHLGIEIDAAGAAQLPADGALRLSTAQSRTACWVVRGREHEAILDSITRAGMAA